MSSVYFRFLCDESYSVLHQFINKISRWFYTRIRWWERKRFLVSYTRPQTSLWWNYFHCTTNTTILINRSSSSISGTKTNFKSKLYVCIVHGIEEILWCKVDGRVEHYLQYLRICYTCAHIVILTEVKTGTYCLCPSPREGPAKGTLANKNMITSLVVVIKQLRASIKYLQYVLRQTKRLFW